MDLFSTRFLCSKYSLHQFSLLEILGSDAEKFLQRQLTNDVLKLENKKGHISLRLKNDGKIQYFLILGKSENKFYILVFPEFKELLKNDLEKYIISDDVEIVEIKNIMNLVFNNNVLDFPNDFLFEFNFYGLNASLVLGTNLELPSIEEFKLEQLRLLSGFPKWNVEISSSTLVNNSILNNIAMSYTKGCFLGLETASKIQNNRGAAFFPMIVEIENSFDLSLFSSREFLVLDEKVGLITGSLNNLIFVNLSREFRVENLKIKFKIENIEMIGQVKNFPYFKSLTNEEKSMEIFYDGLNFFHNNKSEKALSYFDLALKFNPKNAEVVESYGVIKGQMGNFIEAISWMDKLLEIDPNSVMAHTNKSLFLMKLGKIEEAENEKSLAVVKSFAKNGEEFAAKKSLAEEILKKEQRLLKNEKMFLEVLEIDPEDTMALFGVADIYFLRKDFDKALNFAEKVYSIESKNYKAIQLIAKCYEMKNDKLLANKYYKLAILEATKSGNFSLANEMQLRIN